MIRRGEIYFVDLDPTQGREQAGRRPVLVLSIHAINRLPLVVTVVVGTKGSNISRDYPTNVRLSREETGLPMETVFLGFQVRSISDTINDTVPPWIPLGISRSKSSIPKLRIRLAAIATLAASGVVRFQLRPIATAGTRAAVREFKMAPKHGIADYLLFVVNFSGKAREIGPLRLKQGGRRRGRGILRSRAWRSLRTSMRRLTARAAVGRTSGPKSDSPRRSQMAGWRINGRR